MRFEELNWMDVENYLKGEDRAILVIGACEQHGYLSLLTDIKIPQALADAASQQTGILVAPALNFGISPYFLTYPGTISLSVETFIHAVEDIVRSLYRQGFRKLLILNGHGGNGPANAKLVEVLETLPDMQIRWYAWWTAASVIAIAAKHGLQSYHAAWIEAFTFTRVAELPDGVKTPPVSKNILSAEQTRASAGDGVYGGPYRVDDSIMDEIFAAALKDVLELLNFA